MLNEHDINNTYLFTSIYKVVLLPLMLGLLAKASHVPLSLFLARSSQARFLSVQMLDGTVPISRLCERARCVRGAVIVEGKVPTKSPPVASKNVSLGSEKMQEGIDPLFVIGV